MRPAELNRLSVEEAADRYVELVRAKVVTGVCPGRRLRSTRGMCRRSCG